MHKSTRILAVLVGLLASGIATLGTVSHAEASTATTSRVAVRTNMEHHALQIALAKRGAPYRYGAEGPHAFDCSGLTSFAFHHAGFGHLPRTAAEQARFAHRISRSQMRPGDLVFFYDRGGVYHVGVFDGYSHGRRTIVHAPHTGARVRREAIWTNAWFPGTLR